MKKHFSYYYWIHFFISNDFTLYQKRMASCNTTGYYIYTIDTQNKIKFNKDVIKLGILALFMEFFFNRT